VEAIMPAFAAPVTPGMLVPGTVVSVPLLLVFRHKGVVSDRRPGGKSLVISSSARAGGVAEESWETFAGGQIVTSEGYPSNLPPYEVLGRARLLIGSRYDLFAWNCDHLTRYAHGLEPKSPQIVAALLIAAVAIGVAAARRG
jgi:hypothetical protein